MFPIDEDDHDKNTDPEHGDTELYSEIKPPECDEEQRAGQYFYEEYAERYLTAAVPAAAAQKQIAEDGDIIKDGEFMPAAVTVGGRGY
jgi:hypothetical protein